MHIVYTFSDEFCGIMLIKANKPQNVNRLAEAINQIQTQKIRGQDGFSPFQA